MGRIVIGSAAIAPCQHTVLDVLWVGPASSSRRWSRRLVLPAAHNNFLPVRPGTRFRFATDNKMHFEALAESPFSAEMEAILNAPLPQRVVLDGSYRASMAGIGSPVCQECPPPQYTYVAQTKKLRGVVVLQIWVTSNGVTENVKIVRAPHRALRDAAVRGVRGWHFRPAMNVRGEFVPVVVNVAVAFKVNPPTALKAQR